MGINLVIAVTDGDWFDSLRQRPNLAEVNFWAPSDAKFRALQPGELFLFKLHAPRNVIGGGGIFAYANALPCSLAWEAFGEVNGARSAPTLVDAMERHGHLKLGPEIRAALLAMSTATMDRSLRRIREEAGGRRLRRTAPPSSVRRSIPVRTVSDWDDPAPGFAEANWSRTAARSRGAASCRRWWSLTSPPAGPSARRCCTASRRCSARCWARSAG